MGRLIPLGLSFLLLFSCATTTPNKTLTGDTFISSAPELEIRFRVPVKAMKALGHHRGFVFHDQLPVRVNFHKLTHRNLDYYYALEAIVSNLNRIYLGPAHFSGHEWARFGVLNKKGYLLCGYFTRKNDQLIEVYNYRKLDTAQQARFKTRKETMKGHPGFLQKRFDKLDRTLEIIR